MFETWILCYVPTVYFTHLSSKKNLIYCSVYLHFESVGYRIVPSAAIVHIDNTRCINILNFIQFWIIFIV